jgi:hypothetical protein
MARATSVPRRDERSRRTAPTRSTSWPAVIGLTKKSAALERSASTAVLMLTSAVTMITGRRSSRALATLRRSRSLVPRNQRSVRTRSKCSEPNISTAARGSVVARMWG